jgi:hypothetical protein
VDGENRRIGKKVNGALVQGFLYENQLEPVAELDGRGNLVAPFVYCGCGADRRQASENRSIGETRNRARGTRPILLRFFGSTFLQPSTARIREQEGSGLERSLLAGAGRIHSVFRFLRRFLVSRTR